MSNAAPLHPAVQAVRAPVEVFLKRSASLEGAAVIVDPPRAGLSREVVTRLARRRPDRIVYVSCDVATQARDLRALGESGYRIDEVQAFDMFPNTAHIGNRRCTRTGVEDLLLGYGLWALGYRCSVPRRTFTTDC